MAPEQLEGREADPRTDIFALGLVLYEALSGRKAFEGKSQASLIAAILEREPASITSLQPMTPRSADRVVRICLAKDPDELRDLSATLPAERARQYVEDSILFARAAQGRIDAAPVLDEDVSVSNVYERFVEHASVSLDHGPVNTPMRGMTRPETACNCC